MKMVTNSFSSIAIWNPNEPGFSGHVATSYVGELIKAFDKFHYKGLKFTLRDIQPSIFLEELSNLDIIYNYLT